CIGIIHDENDQALGEKRSELVRTLQGLVPFHLGLTATDAYAEDKRVDLLFDSHYYKMGYQEAVASNLISKFETFLVYTGIELSDITRFAGDYSAVSAERSMLRAKALETALELYVNEHIGERICIQCATVRQAKDVARLFRNAGAPAAALTHEDSHAERDRIKSRWKSGKLLVLASPRMLSRSFHDDSLEIVYNLSPSLSPVLCAQRSGRVLGQSTTNPDKIGRIYDFVYLRDGRPLPAITFGEIAGEAQIRKTIAGRRGTPGAQEATTVVRPLPVSYSIYTDLTALRESIALDASPVPKGWFSFAELTSRTPLEKPELQREVDRILALHPDVTYSAATADSRLAYYAPEVLDMIHQRNNIEIVEGVSRPYLTISRGVTP
ncbi:MAG: hypothetical protein KDD60_12710, partial [Bdellovibrionales bacterium]|nr:hypothetical protein [Bdellovibrionales bacterium]